MKVLNFQDFQFLMKKNQIQYSKIFQIVKSNYVVNGQEILNMNFLDPK